MDLHDTHLRRFTGYNLKRAHSMMIADVAATLQPFGLRMLTYSVLAVIVKTPKIRQAQLASSLAIERPNIVLLVAELETAGLVTRSRAADDKRAFDLTATPAGFARFEQADRAIHDHDARLTAGLTKTQRDALIAGLQQIERNGTGDCHEAQSSISTA